MMLAGLGCLGQTGCSIFSPVPLWELAKGAGEAASLAMPYAPSSASNTVYHLHPTFSEVCIEYNPDTPVPDVIPALQIELRRHRVQSRIYEPAPIPNGLSDICPVWLKYDAYVEWATPPLGSGYRTYMRAAVLTLRSSSGQVLSSSQYQLGDGFQSGKWASTQSKLAPVVTALLTGFEK